MSWTSKGTIQSQKKRISLIEKRTLDTTIPQLDDLFSTYAKSKGSKTLTSDLVDKVYFSSFPPNDASITIATLTMNSQNIESMRQSGTLGVIIEMLRRVDFNLPLNETHISDLIRSISILTENNDSQSRLLSNRHAVSCILKLCIKTSGQSQEKIFSVLDRLCRNENSIDIFLSHNIFDYLLSNELLSRPTTSYHVKHSAANLINRMTCLQPKEFPVNKFEQVLLYNGQRIVDGYIEVQLLNAFYAHVNYLATEKLTLTGCHQLLLHLINEIKNESFEDLDHLLQILKCLMIISRDTMYGSYLLENDLNISLQYIVRTDFELWRKTIDTYKRSQSNSLSINTSSSSTELFHRTNSGNHLTSHTFSQSQSQSQQYQRTSSAPVSRNTKNTGTQNTLNAIRNIKNNTKLSKQYEDINFKSTRLVIMIYENIMKLGIHVIGNIVSSGLIQGLLFRVGKGKNIDKRFHKLVTHFIYLLLIKVATSQPPSLRPMSVVGILPPDGYTRAGTRRPSTPVTKYVTMINQKIEPITVRSVSNKLHAQGVTDLMINCLDGEDYEIVSKAVISLASMNFSCIKQLILKEQTLGKICGYTLARKDCFFAGLALVCEAILAPPLDQFSGFLNVIITEFNAISILGKAMKLSGWIFSMKANVYEALAILSTHPKFREKLRKIRAINAVVYEIDARRRMRTTSSRRRDSDQQDDDIATEMLFSTLKKDWAATKIQAVYRASVTRRNGPSRRNSMSMWVSSSNSYISL